ncbi:hypothetical protein BH09MYX1_BH09MYX1_31370 [soil metagenome]
MDAAPRDRPAPLAGLREFFLLEQARERATRLTGERGDRARALHAGGIARRRAADELVDPQTLAPALVLYRDALRLFAVARWLDLDLESEETEASAYESLALAIDALDEPRRIRFRAAYDRLRDPDLLAFDRVPTLVTSALREENDDLFRFLERTVEARSAQKLRVMRVLRIAGAIVGFLFLLRAGIHRLFAPADVALHKVVLPSSRYPGTPDPQGLTDGDLRALGVHTNVEPNPSILIDLGGSYKVRTVRIHNRTDCCFDEGLPLIVEVGEASDPAPFVTQKSEHFDTWDIDVGGKESSTVKLRLPRNGYIALAELEVFADK